MYLVEPELSIDHEWKFDQIVLCLKCARFVANCSFAPDISCRDLKRGLYERTWLADKSQLNANVLKYTCSRMVLLQIYATSEQNDAQNNNDTSIAAAARTPQ